MLVFYKSSDNHSLFIKTKIILSVPFLQDLFLKLLDILIEEKPNNVEEIEYLDIIKDENIHLHNPLDYFYLNTINELISDKLYTILYKTKYNKILKFIFDKFKENNNIYFNYKNTRLFFKLLEIGSFIFLKKKIYNFEKNNHIIFVFKFKESVSINSLFDKIINLIKEVEENDLYAVFILFYILSIISTNKYFINDYVTNVLLNHIFYVNKVLSATISMTKPLSKLDRIVSEDFTIVTSGKELELYAKNTKKQEITILEKIFYENENKYFNLKPICYGRIDGKVNQDILYDVRDTYLFKLLSKKFSLDTITNLIYVTIKNIEKCFHSYEEKKELIIFFFYSLLGTSLIYSDNIKKIDSFLLNINNFEFESLEILFFDKKCNKNVYLDHFKLITIPDSFKIKNYIKSAFVEIFIYKAKLSFLGKENYFIFPIIKVFYKKDYSLEEKPVQIQKMFENKLLDKTIKTGIFLEEGKTYNSVRGSINGVRIKIEYKID